MAEFSAIIRLDSAAWRHPHDPDSLDFDALAEALREIAARIEETETGGRVKDMNGNACGTWELRA